MAPQPLVLLLCADRLTQIVVESGLQTYGYDVALASTDGDALHQLTSGRVGVLVADIEADVSGRLQFVRAARKADPSLTVIYTAGVPSKLSDREKVAGAPCLRTPYHPHQLVSLIGQLTRRNIDGDEFRVA